MAREPMTYSYDVDTETDELAERVRIERELKGI